MPQVDPEKRKEYRKRYYEANKDKIAERCRKYRQENKEAILAQKRQYESQPHRKEIKKLKSQREYRDNRKAIIARQTQRRRERKQFLDEVALRYGCQNPDCCWQGSFDPCQITFHHFDPSQKEIEVAKMHSWSFEKIVAEVNKCVCVCRNCHPLADRGLLRIDESMICKVSIEKSSVAVKSETAC